MDIAVTIVDSLVELAQRSGEDMETGIALSMMGLMKFFIGPLIIVLAGSYLALRQYFLQREHEQLRTRYLNEGFDLLASQIEEALQILRHNWQNGITILKHFRDLRVESDPDICKARFLELNPATFQIVPSYRVQALVKDSRKAIWVIQQKLFAFVKVSTDFYISDICSMIRVFIKNDGKLPQGSEVSWDQLIKSYFEASAHQDEQAKRYYILLEELHNMAYELGSIRRLTLKSIQAFSSRKTVEASIARLHAEFDDMLQP